MIRWSLLDWSFVLLLSTAACSWDCHFQRSKGNWEILHHLESLGKFPLGCLKDRSNFRFLHISKIHQSLNDSAVLAVQEILQQMFSTFVLNVSQSSWNESRLEILLSGIYQQMEKNKVCLEQEMRLQRHSSAQRVDIRLGLKNYFQGIRGYLQDKKYSHCAWEVVRVEILRCFLFIEQLTRRFQDENTGH